MLNKEKEVTEIMFLAMMVNYKTDYCVFVRFSGHVDSLEIDIKKSKTKYLNDVCSSNVSLKKASSERLKYVKETLIGILKENKVDTSELNYWVEEIHHYTF